MTTLPPLDTPEARWAYLLTVWHGLSLPTPESISVGNTSRGIHIRLPANQRDQVDLWAAALDLSPAARHDTYGDEYRAIAGGEVLRRVYCVLDEPAQPAPVDDALAAAGGSVVAMLGGEQR